MFFDISEVPFSPFVPSDPLLTFYPDTSCLIRKMIRSVANDPMPIGAQSHIHKYEYPGKLQGEEGLKIFNDKLDILSQVTLGMM